MNLYQNFPLALKYSAAVLLVSCIAIIAHIFQGILIKPLGYNANLIAQAEVWRLFTGHFLHTNQYHLWLNLAGLVLLWSLHGQYFAYKTYTTMFVFCALLTSVFLYFFSPDLVKYVGLSGVLHGIFVVGALCDIKHKLKSGYLLLIGVIIKIIHEQVYGASGDMVALIDASVAIDAHLFGVISGFVFYLFYWFYLIIQKPNTN